jgi:hypothetical protein
MVLLLGGLGIQSAQASGDFGCSATWSLKRDQLDGCNNMPFLSPANDSRVNLRLLLADQGLAALPAKPGPDADEDVGYGLVPFSLDSLASVADATATDSGTDATGDGTAVVETPGGTTPPDPDAAALADLAKQIGVTPDAAQPAAGDGSSDSSTVFASGEGSRCASNSNKTARVFLEQLVHSTDLPDAERQALARSRLALLGSCTWDQTQQAALQPAGILSPLGKQFAGYLQGAMAFYAGDFPAASRAFAALADSSQPWLKETAGYMAARTLLNQAQANAFDDMGYAKLENVDKPTLEAAGKAFDAYLQAYPTGLYTASAQGLLRRVYWLGGDQQKLAAEYAKLLAKPGDDDLDGLVQETDNKLLVTQHSADVTDPTLLAVMDLMWMRNKGVTDDGGPAVSLATLQQDKTRFISQPALYGYLVAAYHFYVEQDPDKTLQALTDAVPTAAPNYLEFSRQTLRGFALEQKNDWAGAQQLWLQLIPLAQQPLQRAQLELALAMNYERSGKLATVFAPDSPIKTPEIREILLRFLAGQDLLRQQAKAAGVDPTEQDTALYTLLYKDLSRGDYRDFGTDLALLPAAKPAQPTPDQANSDRPSLSLFQWDGSAAESHYTCPSIKDIAATLKQNASSPQGLNCLGEFILRNDLDSYFLDHPPQAEELGGTPSQFAGSVYSRLDGYMKVMADTKAARNDRAYALYRAINCFAPSQFNSCGPQDIPTDQRKQWFQTLKSRYGNTVWAQSLKYYW